jgi:urease accessory protein
MHNRRTESEHPSSDDWLIWQLADSAFPVGSFAHSNGLEATWQQNRVTDRTALRSFIEASLSQAARASLPLAVAAHREPDRLDRWDALCDAMLSNHVANRASRAQGMALLATAERIYGGCSLSDLRASARNDGLRAHLAPVFGFVSNALGVDCARTARLFTFLHLRGLISGAVRLGIVGPLEGQTIQAGLSAHAERMARIGAALPVEEAAQTSPLIELISATQDRLYSRLFQS